MCRVREKETSRNYERGRSVGARNNDAAGEQRLEGREAVTSVDGSVNPATRSRDGLCQQDCRQRKQVAGSAACGRGCDLIEISFGRQQRSTLMVRWEIKLCSVCSLLFLF
ncbi:hypothetical protein RRG08_046093 [Elysia crispata]|uniref:Uncharacterized protein n=1 Tax=Elysia crispata TaxID=231223 RepID=A0AAE1CT96_9GAST|nr:hypothetical protein RRG08_046093 [Elysia crispata]